MYTLQSLKIKNIISFQEQEYQFQNGKALLVVGKNLTDDGQKSNGSGKSALMESLALCIVGSPVRDVKNRELINRSSDNAEVELSLVNPTENNKHFRIWRKIYANSKSAEYKSWINEVEQCDKYSDFNVFNAFVWQTLGISKEDFFSFYFLTGDYKPFLITSDIVKKDIINRFSGADKVDAAFPFIEEDSQAAQSKIVAEEKKLTSNTAKQELLAEQIMKEEEKLSEDKKNEAIAAKENEIDLQKDAICFIESNLLDIEQKITECEGNIEIHKIHAADCLSTFENEIQLAKEKFEQFKFSKGYALFFEDIANSKQMLNKEIDLKKSLIPKLKDSHQQEINEIYLEETELQSQITEAEKDLKEHQSFESNVQKQLHDVIECPSCHFHFSLRNKSFNYDEAVKNLPIVQQSISDYKELIEELRQQLNNTIQAKKQHLNAVILEESNAVRKAIEALNEKLIQIGKEETELKQKWQEEENNRLQLQNDVKKAEREYNDRNNEQLSELKRLENVLSQSQQSLSFEKQKLQSHLDHIQRLQKALDEFRTKEIDRSHISGLEKQLETLINEEATINNQLEILRKEKENIDCWSLHFKGFKSFLANQSLSNIADYTNLFLESMGSNLNINIEGYKQLSNKKLKEQISVTVLRNGFEEGGYGAFSGGERGRISISNTLALAELINLSSPTGGLDFLLIDECLDQVDLLGIESIINSLQTIGKTVLVITQHTEVQSLKELTLTIEKSNHISRILN